MSRFVLTVPPVRRALRLVVREGGKSEPVTFNGSREVRDHFATLRTWAREAFVAFFLDTKNTLIHAELMSVGTVDSAAVYPREVVRAADPDPSLCDREITRDLVAACGVLQIKALDHIILGDGRRSYSFADHGLIETFSLSFNEHFGSVCEAKPWVTP